jgi:signal transduction histidine kinase/ligand-binding sensor domain-containing protein
MKPRLCLYFFILLFLISKESAAQKAQLDFNLVKKSNDITLGKITSITQDRFGYMWFVDQGHSSIIKFDGYKMKSYSHDPSDSNSLDNKTVEGIASDSSGYIWVTTGTGVDKFDPVTEKFIHFRYNPSESGGRASSAILIDHLGIVWVGTSKGLDQLDQKTGKFIHYTHKDNDTTSLSCDIVRCLYEDHKGVLWVGTGWEFESKIKEGGLNRFNRKTGTFTRYMHDPKNPNSLIGDKVRAMFEDSRGVFWVGTDGDGLHIMDRKKGTFERLIYDPTHPEKLSRPPLKTGKDWADHITFITEDGAGAIWIGTFYAGLVRYDPITKEITHYDSTGKSRPKGFTDNSSWCAYKSRDGVLWIATQWEENLFRIDPLLTAVTVVNIGDQLRDVYEDPSGIRWMCLGHTGLLRVDANKHDKKYFKHDPSDPYSISSDDITFIKPDTDGLFWVGTFNGLNRFDSRTGRFTRYLYSTINHGDFADTAIFNLLKEDNGEIYLTTNRGFYIMNPESGLMKRYANDPSDTTSICASFTTEICRDKSGKLWIGTWSTAGLNFLDLKTKKFKHYLFGMTIPAIYKDTRGTIWVGTSNGLYYRNDSADTFLPVKLGGKEFRDAWIFQLGWEDEEKNIWGFSSVGIFRWNPVKNELCVYGKKFGIDKNDFSQLFKTADGRLLLTKNDGYYTFDPKNLLNHTPPQIMLTDFKINGHSVNLEKDAPHKASIEETKEIKLQYNENDFSIDFAAIHYSSPEDNIRYYILQGYDTNWIKADSLNTALYHNIPTGKYVFKIKASSSYGVWSETEVKIIISPPWWLTWWAITLYVFVLLFAVWGIIKWRTKALEKEKRLLEEKVAMRTQELKKEKEIVESTLAELKSTQAQLIQSEKMASLGELTAGIAHEIQNPLNFVNNFSDVNAELIEEMKTELKDGNVEDAIAIANDIADNEKKINHHGKRADGIVKGMLQHSRSSSGIKEPTDINALADEYFRLAYHGLRAKDKSFNATMKTDFDETIGNINVIPQDIGRVILNLITNAFYVVAEKKKQVGDSYEPTVSVSTKKLGDKVLITVKDNGNGIPQKVLDKIFQPFFTTKPTGQGTGLGLSLSYDIVKAQGGEIKVETKEGEGTEFIIQLSSQ